MLGSYEKSPNLIFLVRPFKMQSPEKISGVLLLNLGGPKTIRDVKPFLYRLFSDPDILVGVPSPVRQILAFAISQIKGASSIRAYQEIGGGSPQLFWTQKQADLLEREFFKGTVLNRKWIVKVGMRTTEPSIGEGLRELKQAGVSELVVLPLFPHYSTTTTGSCLKEVHRVLQNLHWTPSIITRDSWGAHPEFIQLQEHKIQATLAALGSEASEFHLLISAHSLPMNIINRGDPYLNQVRSTVELLMAKVSRLFPSWSLAFQSRNGRARWLEPYFEDELKQLAKSGKRKVLILPISFVSDHIETLWELDLHYAKLARSLGFEKYCRVPSINDNELFIQFLKTLVIESFQPDILKN